MIILTFEQFKEKCENGFCLRKCLTSKNCFKSYKQEKCYKKYLKNFEHINNYEKDIEFRQKIIQRDKTCQIWKILNNDERKYILKNFYDEYIELSKILDPCHIVSRRQAPELKYDENNVFLGSRYFHSLLDDYRDLVTRKSMNEEQRNNWILRIVKEEIK